MLLKLAWRNIGRGWRRSAIVAAAIAVGLAACIGLSAWGKGLMFQMKDTAVRTQLAHLAVLARGYHQNPDVSRNLAADAVAARIDARDGAHASPRLRGEGLVQSARRSLRAVVIGVRPRAEAEVSVVPDSVIAGAFLDAVPGARLPPIVLGERMAEQLRVGLRDKVVLHVPGEAGLGAFRVRGLFRTASSEFDRSVAYLRLEDAQRLFGVGERVTEVAVTLDRPGESRAFQAWLAAEVDAELGAGTAEVLRWEEREPRLAAMLDLVDQTYWIFYAVIFVAMAFGIANALLMAVFERTREFGVLRSLGLRSGRLVVMVMLESLLLTLAGTGLGLAAGLGLVAWLGRAGIDMTLFSTALREYGVGTTVYPRVTSDDWMFPLVLAVATAGVAALWPAIKAARLRPADALRRI